MVENLTQVRKSHLNFVTRFPESWLQELSVPQDGFELLYRLGQKSHLFDRIKVEYFAPYLLKEGVVQRVHNFGARPAVEQVISRSNVDDLILSSMT
jgi:hypothetical protein